MSEMYVYGAEKSPLDFIENYKRINKLMGRGPIQKPVTLPDKPYKIPEATKEMFGLNESVHELQECDLTPEQIEAHRAFAKTKRNGDIPKCNIITEEEAIGLVSHIGTHANTMKLKYISDFVFDRHGFTIQYLRDNTRYKNKFESQARAELFYLMMRAMNWTYAKVALYLGYDHSSVYYGERKYQHMQECGKWSSDPSMYGHKRSARKHPYTPKEA